MKIPKVFISYAWESEEIKAWAKDFATKLRTKGINAKLDQWEVLPGDQLPHFMEKSVRDNDYVLIICTPTYKSKSENRVGGVGYEGDIMSAEILLTSNHRKFIPILKLGTKDTAIPSWLQGKYHVDLSSEGHYEKNYPDLITTLLNEREIAPPIGTEVRIKIDKKSDATQTEKPINESEPIRIKGIIIDEITQPRNDNTIGSALYKIPFELNRKPSNEWAELFIDAWNHPSRYTSMHRSGIASVYGNKVILDGTTIEEVEMYHKDTLRLAVDTANLQSEQINVEKQKQAESKRIEGEKHKKNLKDIGGRISFE